MPTVVIKKPARLRPADDNYLCTSLSCNLYRRHRAVRFKQTATAARTPQFEANSTRQCQTIGSQTVPILQSFSILIDVVTIKKDVVYVL